ncbi:MAG: septal ring lytic transglycosylase RlpA family protein [Bacteroidota bacterium]
MIRRTLLCAALAVALSGPAPAQSTTSDQPTARQEVITPGDRRAERRMSRGVASYYARYFHGRRTASGERYDHGAMTVAHKSLPFGTILRVEDERTGRRIIVRVNDRGPFIRGRVLDFSGAAADRLQMRSRGTARVAYEIVDPATLPSRQAPPPRKVRHY